jgi:hypothetical protein
MDLTYWKEDDILQRRMYDAIYRAGSLEIDRFTAHALKEVWRHYGGQGRSKYYWETYVSFGDPSLSIRTWDTRKTRFIGPRHLPAKPRSVSYQIVDEKGVPVVGARVALVADDTDFRISGDTDPRGQVELPLGPGNHFHVTASGQNFPDPVYPCYDILFVMGRNPGSTDAEMGREAGFAGADCSDRHRLLRV